MSIQGIEGGSGGMEPSKQLNTEPAQPSQPRPDEAQEAQPASQAQVDEYDRENSVGLSAKGVYTAKASGTGQSMSSEIAEDDSVGPDDFREVEVLKRKQQRLLRQLACEPDETVRAQLQSQIQQVAAQIAMKSSLVGK